MSNPFGDMAEDQFSKYVNADGNLNLSAVSSTLSMFIWGLVMAKARAGFTAASSKDQGVVSSGFGKMIGLMFLIGVAGLAKWNADSHFLDNAL